ncbi:MAG: alpha/beta hydrolase [Nanoarchaeota archaeon]|nr:alpha/beta hydrolase [Nanoarchaeota archaeon]
MVKRPKTAKNKGKQNKSNKKAIIVILIIVLLLLSFVAYRTWLNIHFFITDDLTLSLEPQDKSLSIHYEEKPNVSFRVDIKNSFFCNAYCSYEFRDISTKSTVAKGSFTSKGIGKSFEKEFQLSVDRIGSGQKIYSFGVQCNNIRTWYCLTDEKKRKRSAFVTLNYDISEYERVLKNTLKENITKLVNELSVIDVKIQELNNRFFELGFNVNLNEIEDSKEILNNDYNTIVLEFENLERVWSEQDYLLLSDLFNKSYYSRISGVKQKIFRINSKIDDIVEKHNSIINELNGIDSNLRSNETVLFLNRINELKKHKQFLDNVMGLKLQIQQNTFADYDFLEAQIGNVKELLQDFETSSNKIFTDAYLQGSYYESLEKEKFCDIKGTCSGKTNFSLTIMNSLNIDNSKINGICSSSESIKETYEEENAKAEELLKNYNIEDILDILDDAKTKKTAIIKKNIFNEIKNITASNETTDALNILVNLSKTDLDFSEEMDYNGFSEDEILSLMQLNLSNDAKEYYNNYCGIDELNISEYYSDITKLNKVTEVKETNFTSRIGIKLTENYPICCVFGVCKRCCTQVECKEDPSLYPILFLHGHALTKDNNPDFSLDAFNKIQTKLQEDGYINAGTITPISDYSEIKQGEWGLSSKPISVKGSYYFVSYYNLGSYSITAQKSENIETYAIRLKELIELLKFRTGRDKVIIIAHSMGGLVARSYMQIFGDDSVDKLIMIVTPNKGISGKVSSYCPVLGENKECEDMSENSIFIKKLNDPLKIPKNVKIHNIVGVGCDMGSETGDGIVVKKNQELEYAKNYYINGTCSGISTVLHNEIRDIDKYPEVYEIIKQS